MRHHVRLRIIIRVCFIDSLSRSDYVKHRQNRYGNWFEFYWHLRVPGKRDLFTAMKVDKKEPKQKPKIVRYSFRQYLQETKRLKYQRVIRNHKKEKRQEEEEKLSDLNGKTVDSIKFQKYIKEKTKINKKLLPLYADLKFRRYRWYSYLERRRAEDKMIHRVKKSFGNDVIVTRH